MVSTLSLKEDVALCAHLKPNCLVFSFALTSGSTVPKKWFMPLKLTSNCAEAAIQHSLGDLEAPVRPIAE